MVVAGADRRAAGMGKHFQQAPGLLRLDETAQAALRKLRDSAPVPTCGSGRRRC